MYKTGVFAGKFLPPHRGHLSQIINSATQCETLYVVVSDHSHLTERLCSASGLSVINGQTRVKWLSQELQGFNHIKVVLLDESNLPEYPNGWLQWSDALKALIPAHIDVVFGGEPDYENGYARWFPTTTYQMFDYERTRYPVSATMVRNDPMKYWDYILGAARPFFAKKVLITGTESCGKTTMVKYLAKMFHTSWSEEAGRYYAEKFLGGNEQIFVPEDFGRIAYMQYESDMHALKTANKVVFYDTDAVVTQYYSTLYLGAPNDLVEAFIDQSRYDMVLVFAPDVTWVADGQRFNGEQEKREQLHNKLLSMYADHKFNNMWEITGDYHTRLEHALRRVKSLVGES